MKKRFDPTVAGETWDAVIIGSGPGSLTAAAILAMSGVLTASALLHRNAVDMTLRG